MYWSEGNLPHSPHVLFPSSLRRKHCSRGSCRLDSSLVLLLNRCDWSFALGSWGCFGQEWTVVYTGLILPSACSCIRTAFFKSRSFGCAVILAHPLLSDIFNVSGALTKFLIPIFKHLSVFCLKIKFLEVGDLDSRI